MTTNCRDCNIRERCIQECSTSPIVKLMMRRAFEAGTDTEDLWGLLQENCLLLPRKDGARLPRRTSLTRRRRGEPEPFKAAETIKKVAPPPSPAMPVTVPEPIDKLGTVLLGEVEEKRKETAPLRYCLAPQLGQHRIVLPARGEIVLGRFDPMTDVSPDVDLSYDDRENHVISRRHARVVGRDGLHEIEDLGSTNGTRVNEKAISIGQKVRLRPGDRVALGYCEFVYVPVPEIPVSQHAALPQAYLWAAFTGHRFPLPERGEVIVGRSDPAVSLVPDIDLSAEGDASQVIARRHIKIITRNGRHYVEDLGSANGTKLNGVRVGIGETALLNPGDHLWLGGCVLAYDVEL